MSKPKSEDELVNDVLMFLFNDGATKSGNFNAVLNNFREENDYMQMCAVFNRMKIEDLVKEYTTYIEAVLVGGKEEKRSVPYVDLTAQAFQLLKKHKTYLNFLRTEKKKEKTEKNTQRWELGGKKISTIVTVLSLATTITLGIVSSIGQKEQTKIKQELERLNLRLDSLKPMISTPQKQPDTSRPQSNPKN